MREKDHQVGHAHSTIPVKVRGRGAPAGQHRQQVRHGHHTVRGTAVLSAASMQGEPGNRRTVSSSVPITSSSPSGVFSEVVDADVVGAGAPGDVYSIAGSVVVADGEVGGVESSVDGYGAIGDEVTDQGGEHS